MIRIIETAAGIAARQPGISMLPVGTYYTDANYGLVVDYLIDAVPDELIPLTLYACRQIDSDFEILKEAPADFTETHGFAGWPPIHELPEEPPLE